MQLIKKYANRKLYHTNEKQYITLDGIARLVQAGQDVKIVDNETGEDITSNILGQIVLQSRRQRGGPLPASLLTDLIQAGGSTISSMHRSLMGVLGAELLVDGEIERRLAVLVAAQKLDQGEANRIRQLLRGSHAEPEPVVTRVRSAALFLPNRADVERLNAQVDELTRMVDQLIRKQTENEP